MLASLLLAACDLDEAPADTAECDTVDHATLTLSATELDFGYVASGSSGTRSIEVANEGPDALGVTDLRVSVADTADFSLAVAPSDCADTVDGTLSGDAGTSVLRLGPGCVVSVEVAYTPTSPWGAQAAVIVQSAISVTPARDPFVVDRLHGTSVVWLAGTTDGEPEGDGAVLVGNVVAASQTAVWEGESVQLEVRVRDGAPVTVQWQDDLGGTFDDPTSFTPVYTAPASRWGCEVEYATIDATIVDADGEQDHTFTRIGVYDDSVGLYCPDLPPRSACEDPAEDEDPVRR
jgi:hypothetical protein